MAVWWTAGGNQVGATGVVGADGTYTIPNLPTATDVGLISGSVSGTPTNVVPVNELVDLGPTPGATVSYGVPLWFGPGRPVVTVQRMSDPIEGGAFGGFVFNRVGGSLAPLTIDYVVGGSAAPGVDYYMPPAPITFAGGAFQVMAPVGALVDSVVDPGETVSATLL